MRIAATYENGMIFQHFGHTETFKLYDIENGQITGTQIVSTPAVRDMVHYRISDTGTG